MSDCDHEWAVVGFAHAADGGADYTYRCIRCHADAASLGTNAIVVDEAAPERLVPVRMSPGWSMTVMASELALEVERLREERRVLNRCVLQLQDAAKDLVGQLDDVKAERDLCRKHLEALVQANRSNDVMAIVFALNHAMAVLYNGQHAHNGPHGRDGGN